MFENIETHAKLMQTSLGFLNQYLRNRLRVKQTWSISALL